jgi:hypothetical protein
MLSKLFARAATRRLLVAPNTTFILAQQIPVRHFRSDFVNPYKKSPIDLTETERTKQENLPVWERTFDFKKYMEHDGPLKVISTFLTFFNSSLLVLLTLMWSLSLA